MKLSRILISALAVVAGTGCFHHTPNPENDPAAIAAMRSEFRLVGRETTWVARGTGYELVGRTYGDLVLAHPALAQASDAMRRVFPGDSLATIVAVVRRIPGEGQPFLAAAPVPASNTRPVVEMLIPDPKARRDEGDERSAMRVFGMRDPALPAIHAWISARANQRSHASARSTQASGDVFNPRVPSWSGEMIEALERDSLTNQSAAVLAAHPEAIIPLSQFFTMEPPLPDNSAAREDRGRGAPAIAGAGVPGGGMGGRPPSGGGGGGRGGRGGGGGRGGSNGGRNEGERAAPPPLGASAAYDAEARVLGRYLKREGYDFIGTLIDTQIAGRPVDEAFAKKQMTIAQAETDWRLWLNGLAAAVGHH